MHLNNTKKNDASYYYKIKHLIRLLAFITQAFLFITIVGSYFTIRLSTHNELTDHRRQFFSEELDSLCFKVDNMVSLFINSGATEFCSSNMVLVDAEKARQQYSDITATLESSILSDRYFSGYYLLGKNPNQYSFSRLDGQFSELSELQLEYSNLINDYHVNKFIESYQTLFVFDKNEFSDIKVDKKMQHSYDEMLERLDGELVYFDIANEVFYILIINRSFIENIFSDIEITNTSVEITNTDEEVICSVYENKRSMPERRNTFTYSTKLCTLTESSHFSLTARDIIFLLLLLGFCIVITARAIKLSNVYAFKIIEPYQIVKNFFSLNNHEHELMEFDYLGLGYKPGKRAETSKNLLYAFINTILIPSLLSSAVMLSTLAVNSGYFIEKKTSISHQQLTQKLYDNFDHYINTTIPPANETYTEKSSRLRYTVVLDSNFSLLSHPFSTAESPSASIDFIRQLKTIKNYPIRNGMLVYLSCDFFGDRAFGLINTAEDGNYILTVLKHSSLGSIIANGDTEFMVLDTFGNIVAQNSYISDAKKERITGRGTGHIISVQEFPEFNWTLYAYDDYVKIYENVYITVTTDIIILLMFMLLILLVAWRLSTTFMRPLERIKEAMNNQNSEIQLESLNESPNEIEEIFTVYNRMVRHIQKITNEKIELLKQEEKINTQKIKAELNVLQHQINPHFLYNTLEMMNLSAISNGDFITSKLISKLSKIFRYAVSENPDSVTIGSEIENIENYFSIWDMRFPDRYKFILDVPEEVKSIPSLKLLLQPVVENCFFHAFDNKLQDCLIAIKASAADGFAVISISDNGCGIEETTLDKLKKALNSNAGDDLVGKSVGIRNIRKRLDLFYGNDSSMTIESSESSGTKVTISFPVK